MHWIDQLYLKVDIGVFALAAFVVFSAAAALVLGRVERVILWFSRRKVRATTSGSPETSAADDSARLNDAEDLVESCTFFPPRVEVVAVESPLDPPPGTN